MEKMKMESVDMTEKNIEKIEKLFPNCITETVDENGILKKAINFEMLKQMLSEDIVEGKEVYEFTWVGKKAALVEANRPIRKTLRPCLEESVNWDTTENLYIEGDNLEVLKLLQESYLGAIKMIYIDPPYNTGNDYIYRDKYNQNKEEYENQLGLFDEEENRLCINSESEGRFHSIWCNMMYSRLLLARNLLSDDGVIFISIDDNEQENLKKICDEVFGEKNFVANLVWQKNFAPKNDNKYISISTEYILLYAKNKDNFERGMLPREDRHNKGYNNPDNDERGLWTSGSMLATTFSESGVFEIISPSGKVNLPTNGRCWRFSKNKVKELIKDNRIWFGFDGNGVPRIKRFLSEMPQGIVPQNLLLYKEVGSNQDGNQQLKELFGTQLFDFPKNVFLLKRLLIIANTKKNDIVLDFFSGSSTTAHAVMRFNAEEGGNRKFIMVQLPEETNENSEAYKSGYNTIAEIGKERIRRASKKISEENPDAKFDGGFRVLKLDDTNMTDVYYSANEYSQDLIEMLESNIKPDRTDLDLLFGCLLEWGLPLSLPYTSENIEGCIVHTYNDGDLIACFDESISDNVIKEIAKKKPLRAVFRDSSFESSSSKINVSEIFKLLSPNTRIKVI